MEYFLFEGRQGYCEQYTAAATLMYRLYGVSARYVSGYLTQSKDFSRRIGGSAVSFPGFDSTEFATLMEIHGWDMDIPSLRPDTRCRRSRNKLTANDNAKHIIFKI